MVDKLDDWDIRWNEPSPQMHTLREHILTLQNEMNAINSIPSNMLTVNERLNGFDITVKNFELNLTLLQLHVLGKITAVEMGNLLRMVHSVDPENHVVAHETVNELLKTIT